MSENNTNNQNSQNNSSATGAGNALAKRGVLKLGFKDLRTLYDCYMPFVKGCGIFVPTTNEYNLGDEAFLLVNLPEGKAKFAVSAKVVWLNPKQKLGKRVPGIGLQVLGKDADKMKLAIEEILGKKVKSPLPNATM